MVFKQPRRVVRECVLEHREQILRLFNEQPPLNVMGPRQGRKTGFGEIANRAVELQSVREPDEHAGERPVVGANGWVLNSTLLILGDIGTEDLVVHWRTGVQSKKEGRKIPTKAHLLLAQHGHQHRSVQGVQRNVVEVPCVLKLAKDGPIDEQHALLEGEFLLNR